MYSLSKTLLRSVMEAFRSLPVAVAARKLVDLLVAGKLDGAKASDTEDAAKKTRAARWKETMMEILNGFCSFSKCN